MKCLVMIGSKAITGPLVFLFTFRDDNPSSVHFRYFEYDNLLQWLNDTHSYQFSSVP